MGWIARDLVAIDHGANLTLVLLQRFTSSHSRPRPLSAERPPHLFRPISHCDDE